MPTETLKPVVNGAGQFERPLQAAYEQWDLTAGKVIAEFPIWQLMMVRIRPDNYDIWRSLGRPYIDATRAVWRQLKLTERDLVVRRHTRAPHRLVHDLEGADTPTFDTNHHSTNRTQRIVQPTFFLNRNDTVTPVTG